MLILLICLLAGAILVVRGTMTKTKWGINFHPPKTCPVCGTPFARLLRQPKNSTEALWGGNTCGNCGTRIDKWGHQIDGGGDRHA